ARLTPRGMRYLNATSSAKSAPAFVAWPTSATCTQYVPAPTADVSCGFGLGLTSSFATTTRHGGGSSSLWTPRPRWSVIDRGSTFVSAMLSVPTCSVVNQNVVIPDG